MQDKQVAIVVNYFPTISETFIVNQIIGLKKAGFNVSLYAYNKVNVPQIHQTIYDNNLFFLCCVVWCDTVQGTRHRRSVA